MKIIQPNPIKKARQVIWKAFVEDPDFKQVYVDNLSVQLYDKLNITDHLLRNRVAEEIIDFMYEVE
jgi:hypothetical protein